MKLLNGFANNPDEPGMLIIITDIFVQQLLIY